MSYMKKYIVLILVLAVGIVVFSQKNDTRLAPEIQNELVLGTNPPEPESEEIVATPAITGNEIVLIGNYKERKTSEELQKEYNCKFLINGGFYTKESTPVGLFKSGNITLRLPRKSLLFDGYFTINETWTPRITRNLPVGNFTIALQSGPVLVENARQIKLTIKNDKEARRTVAIVTGENKVIFVNVHSSTLQALPGLIFNWAKENNISIGDAINLDGGSASTFRSPEIIIPEITPIGSAFCIK